MNSRHSRDFFPNLADYIDFVIVTPEIRRIAIRVANEAKPINARVLELGGTAFRRIEKVNKELRNYVSKNNINDKVIKDAFGRYDAWRTGKLRQIVSRDASGLLGELHDELCDVVQMLRDLKKYETFVARYIEFSTDADDRVRHYLPMRELNNYLEARRELEAQRKLSLWGQLSLVATMSYVVRHGKDFDKRLTRARREKFLLIGGWLEVVGRQMREEWQSIQEGDYRHRHYFFDDDSAMPMISRLHNYFKSRLTRSQRKGRHVIAVEGVFKDQSQEEALLETSSIFAPEIIIKEVSIKKQKQTKRVGFLKLFKRGTKLIPIAGIKTRQFRLVQYFLTPYNELSKRCDDIMKKIPMDHDKNNARLQTIETAEDEMIVIIRNAVRELMRNSDLKRHLEFVWTGTTYLRMTLKR